MDSFIDWVKKELDKRGWSNNELGRQMGMSSSAISLVLTGQRKPTWNFCAKLAQVLEKSPASVLRMAELLPPISQDQQFEEQVLYLTQKLSSESRAIVLAMLDGLAKADIPANSKASISSEEQAHLQAFRSLQPHEREAVTKMIDTLAGGKNET